MQTFNRYNFLFKLFTWLMILLIACPVLIILFQVIEYPFSNTKNAFFILTDSRTLVLLGKSALLAFLVSIFTTFISLPLAYTFANFQFPLKTKLFILILLPFFIPPYIYAISWINLAEKNGILHFLNINIFGFWGSVFVLSCWLFPLAFFFFLSSIRINVRLKEAGSLIKGNYKIFSKITLPLILPGLIGGMFFSFILAITNFGVPSALRLNVYPNEIFIQYGAFFNHRDAVLLSFPLLMLSIIFMLLLRKIYGKQFNRTEQQNNNIHLNKLTIGKNTFLYILSGLLIIIVLILPLISLIVGTGNFNVLMNALSNALQEIWHSVFFGLFTAFILTILGFYLAYFRRKLTFLWLKAFMDIMILLLIAIPGTIYGIILVNIIHINPILNILSNPFPAVLSSNLRYLPISYFIFIAGLSRIPEKYLEAARLTTPGNWVFFRKILIPLNRNSIIGSIIITFVLSFGELDAAIMVYPPGFETLPLRIFSLLHYGANEMVFALSLLQVIIIYIIIVFGFRWINKSLRFYA